MSAQGDSMFAVLETARKLEERYEKTLEQVGLSAAKFGALNVLVQAGKPIPLSELASRLHCVRSNVTQLVDRLEADGLVQRVNDPSDRRAVLAEVTGLGADRHAAGATLVERMEAELAERLNPVERALFLRILSALH
jgi:DNA-binding MarR family transcriptional regulator